MMCLKGLKLLLRGGGTTVNRECVVYKFDFKTDFCVAYQ